MIDSNKIDNALRALQVVIIKAHFSGWGIMSQLLEAMTRVPLLSILTAVLLIICLLRSMIIILSQYEYLHLAIISRLTHIKIRALYVQVVAISGR